MSDINHNTLAVRAAADLSAAQYKAVAIAGTIAANNSGAAGILQNKPRNGEDAAIAYGGRSKFRAGGAVSAGGRIMVTTSGWCVAVTSGSLPCGYAVSAVASGGIGDGVFDFASAKTNVAG